MNLFNKAKITQKIKTKKDCLFCGNLFEPDKRALKRGWGLYCSKSCSVSHRNELGNMNSHDRIREEREKKLRQLGL
jgi:hypothetical protein